MGNYPNPCDTCHNSKCQANGAYRTCSPWLIRYRYRQKQINAFAKKVLRPEQQIKKPVRFAYDHPDDVRRYVRSNPCAGCLLEVTCDTPCLVYYHWYDTRMAIARKRVGL